MRRTIGRDNAQGRRRARRAAARREQHGLGEADIRDIRDLVAAATESLPWARPGADPVADIIASVESVVASGLGRGPAYGGEPSEGTGKDKRLKENKAKKSADEADENTLDAIDAYQAALHCSCGHLFSEHSGANGTCAHADGRGTCSCGEFAYPETDPDVVALAQALIAIRPDLAAHEGQITRIAERMLLSLSAAAGDIVWGPEEGFMDLLCDVNKLLHPGDGNWFEGPWAADASVKLDKVLICDDGDYFVAPITIDGGGDPVLSDKTDWISVEDAGYVESEDAMKLREAIVTGGKFSLLAAPVAEMPEAAEVIPEESDEIIPPAPAAASGDIPWHATFVPEGKLTEDGRAFAPGSVLIPGQDDGARDLPLTLMAMIETSAEGGHDGAKVAGRIDSLYRQAPHIEADGVFSNEEWGQMIARMVENKELTGLSVDIAPLDYSWVPRDQFFSEDGSFIGVWNDEAGEWGPAPGTEAEESDEEPSLMDIFFGEDDRVLLINKAVIGMATVCPFPAFGDAEISLTAAGMPYRVIMPLQMEMPAEALTAAGISLCEECREAEIEVVSEDSASHDVAGRGVERLGEEVLTAAAAGHAPVKPPAEWFENPEFEALTPLTVTDDGRVFGHAWQWETCHLSFERKCVTAPRSEAEYAYFMFGEIACEDGERLNVGRITYDTGHAGTMLSRAEAVRHYDDTGTQAAFVQFGEDEFGGWFAGTIVADFPDTDLQHLRASAISGDWRGIDGNLELVALLAVNVGGFPVPRGAIRAAANIEDPEPLSLVAAGVVTDGRLAHIKAMIGEALVGDLTAEV